MWQEFNNNEDINGKLVKPPTKVFVYYREFEGDYNNSKVTIGYDSSLLRGNRSTAARIDRSFYSILKKGNYSESELAKAWNKINYVNSPYAVLEIHHLNHDGSVIANEVLVSYK